MNYFTLKFKHDKLVFIDQTKLPFEEEYIETNSYERIAEAIEKLEIRGAPAIGVAAGYALALSIKINPDNFYVAYERLKSTRPTAVNLFAVLNDIKDHFEKTKSVTYSKILNKAISIHKEDIKKCNNIGKNGLKLFNKKVNILTHCNTGFLATSGNGTALNVIFNLFKKNLIKKVYVDETRPLLQGARLNAYELSKHKIPFTIITDSMAAYLMQLGKIDAVITGADRIVKNGDTANKIGTYSLAVNAKYHSIPFYIAAPETTIDRELSTGDYITVEERKASEILKIKGTKITNSSFKVFNPSFDVTPNKLISAIITDKGIYKAPFSF